VITPSCMDYFTHPSSIRLFRLWLTLYINSENDRSSRAKLLRFEVDNICCGWGPPLSCTNVRCWGWGHWGGARWARARPAGIPCGVAAWLVGDGVWWS
jgi:hypothetical protein